MIKQNGFVAEEGEFDTPKYYYFDTNQITINKGETKKITITTNNPEAFEQNAVWTIEDNEIAKVIGNKTEATVTALKNGRSTIKLRFKNNKNITEEKSLFITVLESTITNDFELNEDFSYTISGKNKVEKELKFKAHNMSPDKVKQTAIISDNEKIKIKSLSFTDTQVIVDIEAAAGFVTANLTIRNPLITPFSIKLNDNITTE